MIYTGPAEATGISIFIGLENCTLVQGTPSPQSKDNSTTHCTVALDSLNHVGMVVVYVGRLKSANDICEPPLTVTIVPVCTVISIHHQLN